MAAIDDMRQLAMIQDEALKRQAERSLRAFVEQAWPVLEPRTPFLPSWHIDCICEHLEAVTTGDMPRLVINLPPRYMKSLLVTVFWPAWEWLQGRRLAGCSRATASRSRPTTRSTDGNSCSRRGIGTAGGTGSN